MTTIYFEVQHFYSPDVHSPLIYSSRTVLNCFFTCVESTRPLVHAEINSRSYPLQSTYPRNNWYHTPYSLGIDLLPNVCVRGVTEESVAHRESRERRKADTEITISGRCFKMSSSHGGGGAQRVIRLF